MARLSLIYPQNNGWPKLLSFHFYQLLIFISQIGCAPNNYSFASSHSLAIQARKSKESVIGIGYDGPPRKNYSRIYPTTYQQRDDLPKTYEETIETGNGLYIHRTSSYLFRDSSVFGRVIFPMCVGEMPSASLGYLYRDISIQGLVRTSLANYGIGAGATYIPFSNFCMAIGYEHRSEFRGAPSSSPIIYSGVFNKQSIEVDRPTFQVDYSKSIPKTNAIVTFGSIIALSEQYDIQVSASINWF